MNQQRTPEQINANGNPAWRRWVAGLYVALGTAIVMCAWISTAVGSPQIGWDFPVFYIAAHLPVHSLYDANAFAAFWQEQLEPIGVPHWAPYVRPSVFSLPLHLLLNLPYYQALSFWLVGGLMMFFTSVLLLLYRFQLPGFLVPACAAYFPAIGGILSGADIAIYLLAFVAALFLLERRCDRSAGGVLVICVCKFNLILLVPLMLILKKRYRALAVFVFGTAALILGSTLLTTTNSYLSAVAEAPRRAGGFFPVGLRGFTNAVGMPWAYFFLAACVLVICCWLCQVLPLRESFCMALTGALLISPYITWYDSTLLVLPLLCIYSTSTFSIRVACASVLLALPLWEHGGGNNGPIGFMHVSVELAIMAYFIRLAVVSRTRRRQANSIQIICGSELQDA